MATSGASSPSGPTPCAVKSSGRKAKAGNRKPAPRARLAHSLPGQRCLCAAGAWRAEGERRRVGQAHGERGDVPCGNCCSVPGQEAPAEEML